MPDLDVILNRLPRHLVWVCAGCDDCAPLDGSPRSPTPCDGPSQNGAWVIEVEDAESAVREARDATVQEIVELLRRGDAAEIAAMTWEPDSFIGDAPHADDALADAASSLAAVADLIARRFPNGGTHDDAE